MKNMRWTAPVSLGVVTLVLAACGGGGGTGAPPTVAPTPTQTPSSATNASGTLVDDTSGQALSGVNVVLYPWTAGSTTVVAQTTTASNGSFTLTNVANGHYLLVIGSNSPTDTTYATVHDNVTLTGGNQTLHPPKLPTMFGYSAPIWETNGTYRLSKIDATNELPCFQRFNADRASYGLAQVPLDEWSMENVRTNVANSLSAQPAPHSYISSQNGASAGGAGCNGMIDFQFTAQGAASDGRDSRVLWVGADYAFGTTSWVGDVENPFDPRAYADPAYPSWP